MCVIIYQYIFHIKVSDSSFLAAFRFERDIDMENVQHFSYLKSLNSPSTEIGGNITCQVSFHGNYRCSMQLSRMTLIFNILKQVKSTRGIYQSTQFSVKNCNIFSQHSIPNGMYFLRCLSIRENKLVFFYVKYIFLKYHISYSSKQTHFP